MCATAWVYSLTATYSLFFIDIFVRIFALYSAMSILAHSGIPVTILSFWVLLFAAAMTLGTARSCAAMRRFRQPVT